ncbi:AAA family ATPase [Paenibacillus sp. sgz302251]|uniref:AAA family ATPase n=1 Tax=Paenibacillus sp. sgz302251 TaxID=3414493 RepID=UPI003C79B7EA
MPITKLNLVGFTVFEHLEMTFSEGINVFIGENGTGKTHLLKLLYAACQASRRDVSFEDKLGKVFRPKEMKLGRLVRRVKGGSGMAAIEVSIKDASLHTDISIKAGSSRGVHTRGEEQWKENFPGSSAFIPAKEILSHSYNFLEAHRAGNIDFDDTYADIIAYSKVDIRKGPESPHRKLFLKDLESLVSGTVKVDRDVFYLQQKHGGPLEFSLVAEGIRKLALLWMLIKNGTLEKDAVLFWDEPEANINPSAIPVVVGILLALEREGVQIFIATHNYILLKAIDLRKKRDSRIVYHSCYREQDAVKTNSFAEMHQISPNPIIDAYAMLMDESVHAELGN